MSDKIASIRVTNRAPSPRRFLSPASDGTEEQPTSASTALVSAGPFLDLIEAMTARVDAGRRFDSESPEQRLFEVIRNELSKAMTEARRTDMWLSATQVHETFGIKPATLSRWCREVGLGRWARRDGREWMIHIPGFRMFLDAQRPTRSAA